MSTTISSEIPAMSRNKEGASIASTTESTPPSLQGSGKIDGRNDIQVDMAMMMMQRMARGGGAGAPQKPHFPSAASLSSSVWSSSAGYSSESESYAWSASLGSSGGSEDSSDYSSSNSGSSESGSDQDEKRDTVPKMAAPPMPPAMGGFSMPGFGEGLPLTLESLKRDLEKVGRAIISSNAGEAAAERAQTLASINWLASHVPNAVLDQLGHEIRARIKEERGGSHSEETKDSGLASVVENDDMSDVSELSNADLHELDFEPGMTEAADTVNVAKSYGDLAKIERAKLGYGSLPESTTTADAPASNLIPKDKLTIRGSILDLIPQAELPEPTLVPDDSSQVQGKRRKKGRPEHHIIGLASPSGKRSSLTTEMGSKSKSKRVKGLFKRFVKRNKNDPNAVELTESETIDVPEMVGKLPQMIKSNMFSSTVALNPDDSDISQSLAGSSDSSSDESTVTYDKDGAKDSGKNLPQSTAYRCALLFVDISGFTKLSTRLDPESLSKAINSYFQLIVNEVLDGKGDLLKFAGDAVFIEWKATEEINLESCVESAVSCAAKIIMRCADFSVLANGAFGGSSDLVSTQAAKVDTLNVHCGIGAGQMVGVHVGDHELRREYILLGQPIQQATVATDFASLGEVAISAEARMILSRVCDLDCDIALSDGVVPTIIANRHTLKFASRQRMGVHQPIIVNDVSRGVTRHVEGLFVDALRKYRRMMSLYVHPVVVDNDLAASHNFKRIKKIEKSAQERHREEAEIRHVYVMFVNPIVETRISKNERTNRKMYKTLNSIMNLSSREIKRFTGHLRQFIVDDKGLVLIITFGLRGTTIPDLVSQRALPATIAIFNALQLELGIQCKIGATIGEAYCGVVGGVKRHEYAVLGPSVNLAARLMASKMNPGMLVDNNVRMMAHRSYGFNALPPVIAKGYAEPVPIFEPLSPLERAWGRIQPNFVGRKDEIMTIMGMARDMVLRESPSKLVLVESKSGMGKSTMVAHCIEHIRKLMGATKYRLIVTKNVSKESDSLVPFGVFRSILRDALKSFKSSNDDKSYKSGASMYSSLQRSIAWESLSGRSVSQSTCNMTTTKSSDVIQSLCRELDMPQSFVDHALNDLLGLDRSSQGSTKSKPPTSKMMVSFMSRAFKRCTQDAKLAIVALDDLHNADEFSWKVIRDLFETSRNLLIIGATHPEDACNMRIEKDFWKELNQQHRTSGRFVAMELGCLDRVEITSMIMKTLGLQRKEVKSDVLEGVTIQSGGMPHFVNEILEHVKRQMTVDPDFEISDMSYESFGDLVLQRLDAFDLTTRNVLNIGAVIGLSFSLDEVVAVQMRTSDGSEDVVRLHCDEALQVAVNEGLLDCRKTTGDNESESDAKMVTKFAFYHAVWRTALLNLMLEGRKRDLHRTIAKTLEEQDIDVGDYLFNTKLFSHWISSHNFGKSAELALSVGRHFEERLGLPAQSIRLYNDSLDLLRENNDRGTGVGGFSAKVLEEVGVDDLDFIIRIQVALGQALAMAQQMTDSVSCYQDALRITQAARASKQLRDRSILFPVFTGLSMALKRGHIVQDSECRYEQAMVRRYVQETKIHGDPINILHAVSLQADMFARFENYTMALELHKKEIETLYDIETHSLDLCDEYGSDLGAQSFSASTLWHLQLDNNEAALGTCWFVIEELMPKVEKRNVHASFLIVYPVVWVMKEHGFALEARECFEEYVCEAYSEYYGEGRSTFFLPLYDPILMLLDLSGNADIGADMMEEYIDWAMDIDNLGFGTLINSKTGELGRTADSIAAEICYILAQQVEDEDTRDTLIENGIEVATEDLDFCKEKKLALAERSVSSMLANLHELMG